MKKIVIVFSLLAGIFSASIFPVFAGSSHFNAYQIPHPLPWVDGTNTWTHFWARKQAGNAVYYFYYSATPILVNKNASNQNVFKVGGSGYNCRSVSTRDYTNAYASHSDETSYLSNNCPNLYATQHLCKWMFFSDEWILFGNTPSTVQSQSVDEACSANYVLPAPGDAAIPRVSISGYQITDSTLTVTVDSLTFPLQGYTAYTAPVSSVMDHSGTIPYSDSDHQVVAFNGETSDEGSPYPGSTCYGKSDNSTFGSGFNYVGTSGTGGSYYLCYNGHPGYDYPATSGTDIHAPANGTLCVATSVTQQPQPPDVWRDTGRCPLSTAGSTTWSGYHTFYILHEGLYVNGSTNDYMTVFLHSNDLESTVRANVEQYGYAQVSMNQHIAEVGDVGASGAYHVHFEVYKKNGENWDRVDPYGDGTNNILWEQN